MGRLLDLATAVLIGFTWLVPTVGLGVLTPRPTSAQMSVAPTPAATAEPPAPGYVGAQACAACHEKEYQRWRTSDHALAMQEATPATVRGDFNHARLTYAGVTSTFFRRDGRFYVNTDGPDGALRDYPIRYTFGVDPLQQYLIEFPDGRLQALGIAWDTRPKSAGGQRWFHLYPDERVDYRDVLHWTGPAQNWNDMCAECHSTGVKRNFRAEANRFATTWTEIDVACEACHGAGARHVAWAAGDRRADGLLKGFDARLTPGSGTWELAGGAPIAHLSGTRDSAAQIESCARCHARRGQISEDWRAGQPLAQTHRVALLDEPLYYADGQILDEVYEYGSFLQSRMHASGVACTDCHDPHSARLKADGNAVCARCHLPATFDTSAHHHHPPGSEAARCVSCHMPSRLYMVVDRRHDHGFRVPRPDLSVALGTPNPCSDCHRDRSAAWAADAIVRWYGPTRTRGPAWARPLAAGRRHEAGAAAQLAGLASQPVMPAIVRATALDLLARSPDPARPSLIEPALRDPDPLVRSAGLGLLAALDAARQWQLGSPLLDDPVRSVRLEAVMALAGLPAALALQPAQRSAFERAAEEYRAAQRLRADRADAWLNLGVLDAQLGNLTAAEAAYQRAIQLQPSFIPAYVNLADQYRVQGRDADCEAVLRQALIRQPDSAEVHFALGLVLVRQKRMDDALSELARAAQIGRESPHYVYVYAIALDGSGQHEPALAALREAQRRFTGDREILVALVQFSAQAGDKDAAARWAQQLRGLDSPHDAGP